MVQKLHKQLLVNHESTELYTSSWRMVILSATPSTYKLTTNSTELSWLFKVHKSY